MLSCQHLTLPHTSLIVCQVFELPVASLPSEAAAAGQIFDAWQLLQFGDEVLSWMIKRGKEAAGCHIRFHYAPDSNCISYKKMHDGKLPGRILKATIEMPNADV
jgi:hypothetical protein